MFKFQKNYKCRLYAFNNKRIEYSSLKYFNHFGSIFQKSMLGNFNLSINDRGNKIKRAHLVINNQVA